MSYSSTTILFIGLIVLALLLVGIRPHGRGRGAAWDTTGQVAAVRERSVVWRRKPVLNRSEVAVFHATCRVIEGFGRHWQVWPQVSLGEVLATEGRSPSDIEAFRWINSKRCDLLIVDAIGMPLAAIEYQELGITRGIRRTGIRSSGRRSSGRACSTLKCRPIPQGERGIYSRICGSSCARWSRSSRSRHSGCAGP